MARLWWIWLVVVLENGEFSIFVAKDVYNVYCNIVLAHRILVSVHPIMIIDELM